ncbi:MAG TPA: beta-agarase [Verrucomicrobiota bacterium]|nr:beta-agarase [Verrucomicrobiota bacterium]HNU50808.1 beta-agarase [Verrucomicrobiota bacterium]
MALILTQACPGLGWIIGLALGAAGIVRAGERILADFSRTEDRGRLAVTGGRLEPAADGWVRVLAGTNQPWPGIALAAPAGAWDLSPHAAVVVPVRNPEDQPLTVNCRVDNPGADGTRHCVTRSLTLEPGAAGLLHVEMRRTRDDRKGGVLFGMRGYPVTWGGEGTINASNVTQLLVFLNRPASDRRFEVGSPRAIGEYSRPTAWTSDAEPYLPMIDTFGQYKHATWPGKTRDDAALVRAREDEARALEADAGPRGWNRYGGWAAGPQLEATGFFRVQKHGGRWWLVDPEGRLFFSHGIDCVRMFDATPIEERESWFEEFPGGLPGLSEFLIPAQYALKGHYAGRSPRCYSFAGANLRRKYGPEWRTAYPDVIHRRLRVWGLNTIGMWSDEGVRLQRKTPYVDAIGSHGARMIEGSEGYWGKFPDVYDPDFRQRLRRQMEGKRGRSAGDPWCLGYFSDNEMSWGDDVSLALAALASPAGQPAKSALIDDLREKHGGIEALNAAWGTACASWDALARETAPPDRAKAREDLEQFTTRTAEQYFRIVRDVIREVAPQQLYLGCRFAWVNPRAAAAAARYCDVVSYNLYQRSVDGFRFNGNADVPLIIGEFHFGALDRGLFHTGLVPVANQKARAAAYREYVEGALRHPQFVGCHWFQYQDEPTTGRVYDEENYQIGFVDIADMPYVETVEASRVLGESLYRLQRVQDRVPEP